MRIEVHTSQVGHRAPNNNRLDDARSERMRHRNALDSIVRQDIPVKITEYVPLRIPKSLIIGDDSGTTQKLIETGDVVYGRTKTLSIATREPHALSDVLSEDVAAKLVFENVNFIHNMIPLIRSLSSTITFPRDNFYSNDAEAQARNQDRQALIRRHDQEADIRLAPIITLANQKGLKQEPNGWKMSPIFVEKDHELGTLPAKFYTVENDELVEHLISFKINDPEGFAATLKSLAKYSDLKKDVSRMIRHPEAEVEDIVQLLASDSSLKEQDQP